MDVFEVPTEIGIVYSSAFTQICWNPFFTGWQDYREVKKRGQVRER